MPRRSFLRNGAVPDADAHLRLLIAVELLKIDYGVRAAVPGRLSSRPSEFVGRLVLDDKRHYTRLALPIDAVSEALDEFES
jgi:hypothetical protein